MFIIVFQYLTMTYMLKFGLGHMAQEYHLAVTSRLDVTMKNSNKLITINVCVNQQDNKWNANCHINILSQTQDSKLYSHTSRQVLSCLYKASHLHNIPVIKLVKIELRNVYSAKHLTSWNKYLTILPLNSKNKLTADDVNKETKPCAKTFQDLKPCICSMPTCHRY